MNETVKGFLLGVRPEPTPCKCEPPGPILGDTSEPVGAIWICEHRTRGWIAYDPSSARITCMYRSWREIRGRQLKKAVAKIDRDGHVLAVRQTWAPRNDLPEPPEDAAPSLAFLDAEGVVGGSEPAEDVIRRIRGGGDDATTEGGS